MEGSCDYVSEAKQLVDANNSYPESETGTNNDYDGSESGVEPDYSEWVFDSSQEEVDILFDMSDEQAMAALKYFTSTAQRTNMLTKTHSNDLELIAQLLSDKEKDLEMTAKIGQSLLQRNKQLMMKIETMEDYLSQTTENAAQLEHDLQMKSKLVKLYAQDDEIRSQTSSSGSKEEKTFDDEELLNLTNRCRKLEKDNQNLFSEALNLRQMTDEMEEKEETLVMDCIEQLASAKQQITQLTDEIALKFEDNLQQQMEISQLINMVVELQKKQKLLVEENEDLTEQLIESNESQDNLREQLYDMQVKFRETKELMLEHQEELKSLKSRLDGTNHPCEWLSDSNSNSVTHQDSLSLANEIEETVRQSITTSLALERSKKDNRKLLENVRYLNIKGSDTTSGRTSPMSMWSLASDERSESLSLLDLDHSRVRKPTKKLQIVKPMEGSDTLNKWHLLASKNIKGGLDISSEAKQVRDDGDMSTSSVDGDVEPSAFPTTEPPIPHNLSNIETSSDDGGEETPKKTPLPKPRPRINKSSSPQPSSPQPKPVARPRGLSDLGTPYKKTIITRNSKALKSLRHGRTMLKSDQKGGRSQADVIGMIATAMGKVNVEAKAGERILSSLSSTPTHERNDANIKSDFASMPNVAKALEKAAQINENEKELLNIEDDKDSLANISSYDSGTQELNYSDVTSLDENTTIRSPSTRTPSSKTSASLRSITGPLGLLNRANPSEPSPDIMNNLLRYSLSKNDKDITMDFGDEPNTTSTSSESEMNSTTESAKMKLLDAAFNLSDDERRHSLSDAEKLPTGGQKKVNRNHSTGSLVDIMVTNKRKSRPLGMSNLVNLDTTSVGSSASGPHSTTDGPDIMVDDKTRTAGDDGSTTSQSMESGLDHLKEEGGGLFGFLSFFKS